MPEPALIDVAEDERFQRREWLAERIAWTAFALILAAAALGAFGAGPLSHATARGDGLTVRYERLARGHAPMLLVIDLAAPGEDSVVLEISGPYLTESRIEQVSPAPAAETVSGDTHRFSFAVEPARPVTFTFRLVPTGIGRKPGAVRAGEESLPISMFVFP